MGSNGNYRRNHGQRLPVGDGNDVTAEVRVNGVMIEHSPIKLADVTTGLDIDGNRGNRPAV